MVTKEYNLNNKVFKIVADQARSVKKVFKKTVESEYIVNITRNLIQCQRKLDTIKEKAILLIQEETENAEVLNKSIEEMNATSVISWGFSVKKKAAAF